jgi:hypothetical protein
MDGLQRIIDSPQVSENPIGRLVRSGLAGALGGWVTSLAPSIVNSVGMVESTELEVVEEVVTKVTDIISDVL